MPNARYWLRTWLRRHLPIVLAERIPKGQKDCGRHDWYNHDDTVDHCYHCAVGVRVRPGAEHERSERLRQSSTGNVDGRSW